MTYTELGCAHPKNHTFKVGEASIYAGSEGEYKDYLTDGGDEHLGVTLNLSNGGPVVYEKIKMNTNGTYQVPKLISKYAKTTYPGDVVLSVSWPDGQTPMVADMFWTDLVKYINKDVTNNVYFHCIGGHGRTGTALAIIAGLSGVCTVDPVKWIRKAYCKRAVETEAQIKYVAEITGISCTQDLPEPRVWTSKYEDQSVGPRNFESYDKGRLDADDKNYGSVYTDGYDNKVGVHWNAADGYYYSDWGAMLTKDYHTSFKLAHRLMHKG